jgi:hypothetical protein
VRAFRGGKKKLTVAFHFQFANQAGWECDACRKSGLEKRRRCGWTARAGEAARRVVWARKAAASEECPRSYITAQSLAWVEAFLVGKRLGTAAPLDAMAARDAEAFLILEREWEGEGGVRGGE